MFKCIIYMQSVILTKTLDSLYNKDTQTLFLVLIGLIGIEFCKTARVFFNVKSFLQSEYAI